MTNKELQDTINETKAKLALKYNSKGEAIGIQNTLDNVDIILQNEARFKDVLCYDQVDNKIYKAQDFDWNDEEKRIDDLPELSTYDIDQIKRLIQRDYGIAPNTIEDQILNTAMHYQFNPIKMLLESLKWDGKEHIRKMLPKYLGVEDDDYQYRAFKLFLIALIERQYNPGTKFDCALALSGDQGIGKSTFCRLMAFNKDKYFTDNLGDMTDTDTLMQIDSSIVVEICELLSLKKTKDQEAFKRCISAQSDYFRPPYGHNVQLYLRKCIFVATTNDIEFLSDITGARRWITIECHAEKIEDKMKIQTKEAYYDMMAAYAEAMHDWRILSDNGKKKVDLVGMSYALSDEAKEHAKQHEEEDPYEGEIGVYLEKTITEHDNPSIPPRVCCKEIAIRALRIYDPSRFQLKDIARILDNKYKNWKRVGKQKCGEFGVQTAWQPTQEEIDKYTKKIEYTEKITTEYIPNIPEQEEYNLEADLPF